MEDTRIERLEERMNELDKKVAVFEVIMDRFNASVEKLSVSIDNLNITVAKMQTDVAEGNRELIDLKTKINRFDDSSTINLVGMLKQNILPIIMFIYIIIEHIYGFK